MTAIIREERIGGQRLIQGDCMAVMKELGPVDAVVTDPPYGMNFRSNYRKVKHNKIANDGGVGALQWACQLAPVHSSYIWMRWDNLKDIPMPRSLITWVKNNHTMGDLEHEHGRKTEVCAFYKGVEHFFPKGRPSDVLSCAGTGNVHHPTQKPVDLIKSVIEWTNGVVFDPFMGSGTTLVACQKLGRKGTGIELDESYFNIACERVQKAVDQPDLFIDAIKIEPQIQERLFDET